MKNKIEFSKDGSSFSFIFADGSESIEICSKEAGFKAVTDLAHYCWGVWRNSGSDSGG